MSNTNQCWTLSFSDHFGGLIYSCKKRHYRIWGRCIIYLWTRHEVRYRVGFTTAKLLKSGQYQKILKSRPYRASLSNSFWYWPLFWSLTVLVIFNETTLIIPPFVFSPFPFSPPHSHYNLMFRFVALDQVWYKRLFFTF